MFYTIQEVRVTSEAVELAMIPRMADRRVISVQVNPQTNAILLKRAGEQFVPLEQFLEANENSQSLKKELTDFIATKNYAKPAMVRMPVKKVEISPAVLNVLQPVQPAKVNPNPDPNPNPLPVFQAKQRPLPTPVLNLPLPPLAPVLPPLASLLKLADLPAPIIDQIEPDMDEDLKRVIELSLDPTQSVPVEQEPLPEPVPERAPAPAPIVHSAFEARLIAEQEAAFAAFSSTNRSPEEEADYQLALKLQEEYSNDREYGGAVLDVYAPRTRAAYCDALGLDLKLVDQLEAIKLPREMGSRENEMFMNQHKDLLNQLFISNHDLKSAYKALLNPESMNQAIEKIANLLSVSLKENNRFNLSVEKSLNIIFNEQTKREFGFSLKDILVRISILLDENTKLEGVDKLSDTVFFNYLMDHIEAHQGECTQFTYARLIFVYYIGLRMYYQSTIKG